MVPSKARGFVRDLVCRGSLPALPAGLAAESVLAAAREQGTASLLLGALERERPAWAEAILAPLVAERRALLVRTLAQIGLAARGPRAARGARDPGAAHEGRGDRRDAVPGRGGPSHVGRRPARARALQRRRRCARRRGIHRGGSAATTPGPSAIPQAAGSSSCTAASCRRRGCFRSTARASGPGAARAGASSSGCLRPRTCCSSSRCTPPSSTAWCCRSRSGSTSGCCSSASRSTPVASWRSPPPRAPGPRSPRRSWWRKP